MNDSTHNAAKAKIAPHPWGTDFEDDLFGFNGDEKQAAAQKREAERLEQEKKQKEIDAVLERTGISKEDLHFGPAEPEKQKVVQTVSDEDPMSILFAAQQGSAAEPPRTDPEPATDWLDELKADADAKTADPEPAKMPGRMEKIAGELADKMVPHFGENLRRYDTAALVQYGFPPAIDALLTKTNIDDYRVSVVLQSYEKAFQVADKWEREAFAITVTDEAQTDLIAEASRLYKLVQQSRIQGEKVRKEIKEPALRECQLIDGVAGIWKDRIAPIESHLRKQAQFAEERERERQAKLREDRWEKLKLFVEKEPSVDLGKLPEDEWTIYYKGVVADYEQRQAVERAEEERRQKELADLKANAERLRIENERIEKERKEAADREAEANRIAAEARLKAEKAQAELDRQEAARVAERQRIEREAEIKRLAPDKQKLQTWFAEIEKFSSDNRPKEFASELPAAVAEQFFDELASLVNRYSARVSSL